LKGHAADGNGQRPCPGTTCSPTRSPRGVLSYPAPCPPRPASAVAWSMSSPDCSSSSVITATSWSRRRLDWTHRALPPPTARSPARRTGAADGEAADAVGSLSGWELVSRCPREPSWPGSVWRTWRGRRKRARRNRLDAMLRAAFAQLASGQPVGRRTGPRRRRPKNWRLRRDSRRRWGRRRGAIRAPQEQASQTYPLFEHVQQ
jgi:hypothetical protein